jgi:ketosteroid isomerase-like protein
MWDAIERGEVARDAEFIHPDYTGFGANDPYLAVGTELEVRSIAEYLERATKVHTEMHQPRVNINGNVAWIVYYWTDSGWSEGKRFSSRGKSTRVFVKENGQWLCIHGHFTAVP